MIRLQSVHKSFNGQEVLRGIDLEIRSGEITVILGGSGQGKTVLLATHQARLVETLRRRPTDEEYAVLRDWVEDEGAAGPAPGVPAELATRPRDLFGRPFDPARETYAAAIRDVYRRMMGRFTALNAEAFAKGLDVLVFPQGTRSIRLSRGHPGMSQIAIATGRTIVPVGCSGSDRVYPGGLPLARGGRIVFRFGEPIRPPALGIPFEPFQPADERRHRAVFQGLVDEVMERIDGLVDEPYRFGADRVRAGVAGSHRLV